MKEFYHFEWYGKADSLKLAQEPTTFSLQPCPQESINFDATENLFIEGDNIDVLKILQKDYNNKIKMIYIDPPYNTGNKYIYNDKFTDSLKDYIKYAGKDAPKEGRFHTNWLNMMYPRLYLARNLLRDDGVIFISIDDNEVSNLRKLCDEIFGEENFVALLPWKGRGGGADSKTLLENHEYVLFYTKNKEGFSSGRKAKVGERFPYFDKEKKKNYKIQLARKWGSNDRRQDRPNLYYEISTYDGIKFFPKKPNGSDGRWRWSKEKMRNALENRNIEFRLREDKNWEAYEKIYEPAAGESRTVLYSAWLQDEISEEIKDFLSEEEIKNTAYGTKELGQLFNGVSFFDYPKPTSLMRVLIKIGSVESDDIALDFFAGSATTAHAVLELNKQDAGNRKFILVQIPERCSQDSEAFKAGYKTISDIGKERIRRVIKNLNEEDKGRLDEDRGFRVLKLDKSNFQSR